MVTGTTNGRFGRWRWLPLLMWMAAIFFFSHQTPDEIPSFGGWDVLLKKGAHFLAYGLLASLAWLGAGEKKRPFLLAAIITMLYAVFDELHQRFVPGRNGRWLDVLIDSLGGWSALITLRWGRRRWAARHRR